jgi:hypothetical protein
MALRARARRIAALALLGAWLLAPAAGADSGDGGQLVFTDGIDGRAIYERVVGNRFRSFSQDSRLVSADRAGRTQESRFHMDWKDFRGGEEESQRGILSKTLVKYTFPFDLRFAGYLVQVNRDRPNDQFVYRPSRRRVVRVNLRNEAVYGTDFSFEDVVPREAQDFDYRRLPDEALAGRPVWVVELFPKPFARSEYSRIWVYVDRERNLVLRARYWDAAGVEVKELSVDEDSVKEFDGVWVPLQATMRNLVLDTQTQLIITELTPNPSFTNETFDLAHLESH